MSHEWIPLVTRKESPLWVSLVCLGGQPQYYRKALDWEYSISNYRYCNKTHSIAVEDALRLAAILEREIEAGGFFENYLGRCRRYCHELESVSEHIAHEVASASLERGELLAHFARFSDASMCAMPFLASLVLIQDKLEAHLRLAISSALDIDPNDSKVTQALDICVVPSADTGVVREARSVLKLATELEASGIEPDGLQGPPDEVLQAATARCLDFAQRLELHIKQFGWLRTFTYLGEPFTSGELLDRIRNTLHCGGAKSKLMDAERRAASDRAKALATAKALHLTNEHQALLSLAREYLYWRFERIDVHFRSEVRIRPLEECIARELNLERLDLVHLTYPEIISALNNDGQHPGLAVLTTRRGVGFSRTVDGGHFSIDTDAQGGTRIEPSNVDVEWPLRGITACAGTAQGPARLILSAEDIHVFNRGEILVTTMTTPDLMLAIEQCSAIVTDEGGLLCHAAIISRELQIPCVIGTKVATRAIADGQQLRVTATTSAGGIVDQVGESTEQGTEGP